MKKIFLFGIDGAAPELIFDKWVDELPTIKKLMKQGCYAKLNSTIPPSTIIAWNSMFSGKDASELGIFSYTKNKDGKSVLVDSNDVKCERIWDTLSNNNKKTISLFVPLTYPVKKINGVVVSGFLTPYLDDKAVYPKELREKISKLGNTELFFDVSVGLAGHKGLELADLLERTYEMTDMQIKLTKEMISSQTWDLFISVMIGTDRLQHMTWRHFDASHRRFIKDSPFKSALKNYYKYLDKQLAEMLKLLDEDTIVIVCSDHGMVKQEGKININNWLMQEGYLVLRDDYEKEIKEKKTKLKLSGIDFNKTAAYAGGAYNARIFLNKEFLKDKYEKFRDELINKIKEIPDDDGKKLETYVFKKEEIYKKPDNPECPDLTIYFDDLRWASNPDLGQEGLYSWETAVGADSAGHSRQGCFVISGKGIPDKGQINDIDIKQVAPTILSILGIEDSQALKNKISLN